MSFLDWLFNDKTILILLIASMICALTALLLSFSVKKPSWRNLFKKKEVHEPETIETVPSQQEETIEKSANEDIVFPQIKVLPPSINKNTNNRVLARRRVYKAFEYRQKKKERIRNTHNIVIGKRMVKKRANKIFKPQNKS